MQGQSYHVILFFHAILEERAAPNIFNQTYNSLHHVNVKDLQWEQKLRHAYVGHMNEAHKEEEEEKIFEVLHISNRSCSAIEREGREETSFWFLFLTLTAPYKKQVFLVKKRGAQPLFCNTRTKSFFETILLLAFSPL
jgi:hypothetical protein